MCGAEVRLLLLMTAVCLTSLPVAQGKSIPQQNSETEQSNKHWYPTEQWYHCHGYPCDYWESLVNKVKRIKTLVPLHLKAEDAVATDQKGISEESLDDCVWFNEDQLDSIAQNLAETEREGADKEDQGSAEPEAKHRSKRKLSVLPDMLWNLPIPWKFDGNHTEKQKNIIRGAFAHWEEQTCVRFKELQLDEECPKSHILITREYIGFVGGFVYCRCRSSLGRQNSYPQQLNLWDSCLSSFGIVVHEIGHALGLGHEQQRQDRDDYIKVIYSNVGSYSSQFVKLNMNTLGVHYDVGSVMHYNQYDGSRSYERTIETLDPLLQNSLGQRTGLSFLDAEIINRAYCKDVCASQPLPQGCLHGGYQDPNKCTSCKCPDGFSGTYCQLLAPSDSGCGGKITLDPDKASKYISSPGYSTTKEYKDHQQCNWHIRAPRGYSVRLKFVEDFAVYCHAAATCHHWVEVKCTRETLTTGIQGARFCCYQRPDVILTSEDNEMVVTLRSNWTVDYKAQRRGFKALLTLVKNSKPQKESTPPPPTTIPTTQTSISTIKKVFESTLKPNDNNGNHGPSSVLWSCDFEDRSLCRLIQEQDDDFDWTRQSGPTPSEETGPEAAQEGQFYLYIEASDPRKKNDLAKITLPKLRVKGEMCLTFYYNMNGFHVNNLRVTKTTSTATDITLWQRYKQQGTEWHLADVNIYMNLGDKLSIIAQRGSEFSGDIAIDNLILAQGFCQNR